MEHRCPSRQQIELRAYQLWKDRGQPWGTPETDWFEAEKELMESKSMFLNVARQVGAALGTMVVAVTEIDPRN
jgi:hypothetical protein